MISGWIVIVIGLLGLIGVLITYMYVSCGKVEWNGIVTKGVK